MKYQDNLLGVIQTLYKRRKFIIYTCLAAGVLTAAFSLLLPNYYKATTVFLAGSPDQANPQLLFNEGGREAEYYGTDNDIDRILTLAESNELIQFLVDSFQLYEHYKINPDHPKAAFKVREKFLDHYEIKKTARDAIELWVEDIDRELASQMANSARNKIDQIVQQLVKMVQKKNLATYENRIASQEIRLQQMGDSLIQLRRKYGIYNAITQGDYLTTELTSSEASLALTEAKLNLLQDRSINIRGKRDTIAKLQAQIAGIQSKRDTLVKKLESFNKGAPAINTISKLYFEVNESLAETQEKHTQLLNTYKANIPALILVEEAAPPIVKFRPRRSIIVIAAGFIALFFSIIGILLFDLYKDIDWKEVVKS